jgi:hypothetical protein
MRLLAGFVFVGLTVAALTSFVLAVVQRSWSLAGYSVLLVLLALFTLVLLAMGS